MGMKWYRPKFHTQGRTSENANGGLPLEFRGTPRPTISKTELRAEADRAVNGFFDSKPKRDRPSQTLSTRGNK